MSQLRLVASQNSNSSSRTTNLGSVKCRMSRAVSHELPSVARKVAQLAASRPTAAAFIERLVDDMLEDIARGQL